MHRSYDDNENIKNGIANTSKAETLTNPSVIVQGYGLMMFEDKTYYEGELGMGGTFAGKGSLHYPSGDTIEGTFTGSWEDGIKINGVLQKSIGSPDEENIPK